MSNNILEPIPAALNDYLLKYSKTVLSDTVPAALGGTTNVTWQQDGFGNISACVAASSGGGSVGTVGQVQVVGSTAGSFAASSLTDDGTSVVTTEPLTVKNILTSGTNGLTIATVEDASTGFTLSDGVVFTTIKSVHPFAQTSTLSLVGSASAIAWTSGPDTSNTGQDTSISRISAGVLALGNGTVGNTTGTLELKNLSFVGTTTATSATAGAATALPATPLGYLEIIVAGTTVKVPYYTV